MNTAQADSYCLLEDDLVASCKSSTVPEENSLPRSILIKCRREGGEGDLRSNRRSPFPPSMTALDLEDNGMTSKETSVVGTKLELASEEPPRLLVL